MYVLIKHTSFL